MRGLVVLALAASFSLPGGARAQAIPLDGVPEQARSRVKLVLDSPTLSVRAGPETFLSAPDVYRWLLDNPVIAIKLWRQLGASVSGVEEPAPGRYVWKDGQGSEVHWHTVVRTGSMQAWYAEGKIKPSVLLPLSAFKAVCIIRYTLGKDAEGRPVIRHQSDFHVRCDGAAMALAARVLGGSAPRLGEHYLGQMQVFFGGMSSYLCQDTARARRMLVRIGLLASAD
jgi:hypothetical protein